MSSVFNENGVPHLNTPDTCVPESWCPLKTPEQNDQAEFKQQQQEAILVDYPKGLTRAQAAKIFSDAVYTETFPEESTCKVEDRKRQDEASGDLDSTSGDEPASIQLPELGVLELLIDGSESNFHDADKPLGEAEHQNDVDRPSDDMGEPANTPLPDPEGSGSSTDGGESDFEDVDTSLREDEHQDDVDRTPYDEELADMPLPNIGNSYYSTEDGESDSEYTDKSLCEMERHDDVDVTPCDNEPVGIPLPSPDGSDFASHDSDSDIKDADEPLSGLKDRKDPDVPPKDSSDTYSDGPASIPLPKPEDSDFTSGDSECGAGEEDQQRPDPSNSGGAFDVEPVEPPLPETPSSDALAQDSNSNAEDAGEDICGALDHHEAKYRGIYRPTNLPEEVSAKRFKEPAYTNSPFDPSRKLDKRAEDHIDQFFKQYFLSDDLTCDFWTAGRNKTWWPIILSGVEAEDHNKVHAKARRVVGGIRLHAGLHTCSAGAPPSRVIIVGWEDLKVWKLAEEINTQNCSVDLLPHMYRMKNKFTKLIEWYRQSSYPANATIKGSFIVRWRDSDGGWDVCSVLSLVFSSGPAKNIMQATVRWENFVGSMVLAQDPTVLDAFIEGSDLQDGDEKTKEPPQHEERPTFESLPFAPYPKFPSGHLIYPDNELEPSVLYYRFLGKDNSKGAGRLDFKTSQQGRKFLGQGYLPFVDSFVVMEGLGEVETLSCL